MIKEIVKYTNDWYLYPDELFNTWDKVEDKMMELTKLPFEVYYPFHCGAYQDRYWRMVNLRYVDACMTESHDDLTKYGFKKIRMCGDYGFWVR